MNRNSASPATFGSSTASALLTGALALAVATVAPATAFAATATAAAANAATVASATDGPTVGIGAPALAQPFDYGDIPPGIVHEGSTVSAVVADAHLVPSPASSTALSWRRYSGSSIDTMTRLPDADNSAFTKVHGDDLYWLTGIWRDQTTGAWYATVHVEYQYTWDSTAAAHLRRIMLAKSTDRGATWSNEGDIITPDSNPSPPAGAADFGPGDQRLVVDTAGGYFYIFFWGGYTDATGWYNHQDVARCPISQRMAPGCWTKWYQGGFTQPGLGGHDGTIMPFTAGGDFDYRDVPAFSYNTSLGRFIAVGHDWISTATDLNTQDWSQPVAVPATAPCNYTWAYDPASGDPFTTGASWRLYGNGFGGSCGPNVTRYYPVTVDGSTPADPTAWFASAESFGTAYDQWRYDYTTDGGASFHPMAFDTGIREWVGSERYCTVFSGSQQHPGVAGCDSARTWVAPYTTTVTVGANGPVSVAPACGSTSGVSIRVLKNSTQIWPAAGAQTIGNGGSVAAPSFTTSMAAGDQLHFLVAHAGTSNLCDATTWSQTVVSGTGERWSAPHGYSTGVYQWRYDSTTDGGASFHPMAYDTGVHEWLGSERYCTVFSGSQQHPGVAGCDSARTWVAPSAMTVAIGASGPVTVAAGCNGNTSGVTIRILKNTTQIWPATRAQTVANGTSFTVPTVTTTVAAGDQLHFVVSHAGTSNACDSTRWDQTIRRS